MRILIFGSNGMLGTYLLKFLEKDFTVVPITRNDIDLSSSEDQITNFIVNHLQIKNSDIIINASGIIKQRNYDLKEMIMVNSVFPNLLAKISETVGNKVIHITTDCVYNGVDGRYTENDPHNCEDEYGKTKSLGENKNLTIIRTSIIGEENNNKKSLIEWVKSQKNGSVNGFTNHIWNGVTCLELAKFIKEVITNNSYWTGVRHIFSPVTVTKYELVKIIAEIYDLNIQIIPSIAKDYCNRSLKSIYTPLITKSLVQQIQEQSNFSIK